MKKEIFTNLSEEDFETLIQKCIKSEFDKLQFNDPSPNPLIKAKEACSFLQVSKVTLFKWLKEGKIKGYYLGTRLYFKQDELENAITLKTN